MKVHKTPISFVIVLLIISLLYIFCVIKPGIRNICVLQRGIRSKEQQLHLVVKKIKENKYVCGFGYFIENISCETLQALLVKLTNNREGIDIVSPKKGTYEIRGLYAAEMITLLPVLDFYYRQQVVDIQVSVDGIKGIMTIHLQEDTRV